MEFINFFANLFNPAGFVPRAICGKWTPGLIWLHNSSDFMIWTAYIAIPVVLVKFAYRRRQELPFKQLFWLFGLFILACGTTHLMDIIMFYDPLYRLSGLIKLITAAASWGTVIALFHVVPQALRMRTPEALEQEIVQRLHAEAELKSARDQLEVRVEERTVDLEKANADVRASQRRYQLLTEVMPHLIWTARPDGAREHFNRHWYDYTGLTYEESCDWGWEKIVHPDDLQLCLNRWRHSIATGDVYEAEYRFKRADGVYRWQLGRALPHRNDEGEIVQWVGTCTDIDDRKQVEEGLQRLNDELEVRVHERTAELKASNDALAAEVGERTRAENSLREVTTLQRAILDGANFSIISTDANGTIQSFNKGAEKLLGYTADEVLGKQTPAVFHEPSELNQSAEELTRELGEAVEPGFAALVARAQRGGADENEWHYVRKDGRKFPVLLSVTSLRDDESGVSGFLSIGFDITVRRQAQMKARALLIELERSNAELQNFASVASHDLQEPLRKIQAFGDRLGSQYGEALADEGRDYLSRMQDAARRMGTLIHDLLEFSRVASKAQPYAPVDLNQIAEGVASDLEARLEQTGGKVELADLPSIDADPLQMRQLLQNLIGNGLKFHRPDVPPLVRVECETMPDENKCRLTVTDNGIGFDEKYLDRIFTVFQRLHGRQQYEGTGVGLAIVKKIAERHNGTITAQSAPGEGAKFIVTLPMHQEQEADTMDALAAL